MKNIFYCTLFAISLAACGGNANDHAPDVDSTNVYGDSLANAQFIGAKFDLSSIMNMAAFVEKTNGNNSIENVVIAGKIAEVCQKKGCWMNIESTDSTTITVRFKDYGFFMPLDCAGKTAIMHGRASYDTISVEDLQHKAEDAGKSAEEIAKITQPSYELEFEADGVVLK